MILVPRIRVFADLVSAAVDGQMKRVPDGVAHSAEAALASSPSLRSMAAPCVPFVVVAEAAAALTNVFGAWERLVEFQKSTIALLARQLPLLWS